MPPSAIIDASILVSAFLFPDSTPGRVVTLAGEGAYTLHLSPILLEEVRRSLHNSRLRRSYVYTDDAIEAWCARLLDLLVLARHERIRILSAREFVEALP